VWEGTRTQAHIAKRHSCANGEDIHIFIFTAVANRPLKVFKMKYLYLVYLCFFNFLYCNADSRNNLDSAIYGKWICVNLDVRGYQDFPLKKAQLIQKTLLCIDDSSIRYADIDFIEPCHYYDFKISNWDTTEELGLSLEYKYYPKELHNILQYTPVDKNGGWTCYNNCAHLYLKGDTLINICGGYTYYLVKSFDFTGVGNANRELKVNPGIKKIKVKYNFYQQKGELTVSNQKGEVLYKTGKKATKTFNVTDVIPVSEMSKLTFNIRTSQKSSRWSFSVLIE
jgi:hypothetical protein